MMSIFSIVRGASHSLTNDQIVVNVHGALMMKNFAELRM